MSIKRIFVAISAIFAASTVFADNSSVTSKKYVDDLMSGYQGKLPGSGANTLMIYDDETGIGEKAIAATLGNSASAVSVPTVGAVKDGLDDKQDTITGTAGYVMTGTGYNGSVGEKPIYSATNNYSDALVTAEAVNTGVINAVNNSLIRVNENGVADQDGTLWQISDDLVAINANVPYGYTELQYIEFDGNSYILTNINSYNSDAVVNMKIKPTATDNTMLLYGQNPNNGYQQIGLLISSNKLLWQYGSQPRLSRNISTEEYTIQFTNGDLVVDSITMTGAPTNNIEITSPVLVGAAYNSSISGVDGRGFNGRIYSFSYKLNGQVLVNLVPAKNASDEIGMYDTVSKQFFTNQGSGTLTPGPAVVGN